jgi:hypothetical protein
MELGSHVASLGMRFYTGAMFPESYRNQIFIAEHGSWNRSDPVGYRITLVRLKENRAVSYEAFAEGWLQDGNAWGRLPLLEMCADTRRSPVGAAGSGDELPTAVRADPFHGLGARGAERALEAADHRPGITRRHGRRTPFADVAHLQHGRIIASRPGG